MAINPKFPFLFHGGDYNPDQWPDGTQLADVPLMRRAHTNMMSVGIFAWSQLEPREGQWNWQWLDNTFERLHAAGIGIALATPSSSPPRWLTLKHPEIVHVDDMGVRGFPGGRQRFCPTAPVYREHVARVNAALAQRYGRHPALALWHISNEYHNACHCKLCTEAFRGWLKDRYGDLETLNTQWWGTFWSQRFSDWAEVIPPFRNAGYLNGWNAHSLDWRRFRTHQMVDFMKHEIASVRAVTPEIPVTNNLMGLFPDHDYARFADAIDLVSWDSYPTVGEESTPHRTAFTHALMRGVKQQKPWLLMEQTPSNTNWQEYGTLKPPGVLALWSWQAIAHGSDGAMYFQWRRSLGSSEKFHGAVVEHEGSERPRVFREVASLGDAMKRASGAIVGTRVAPARVGILWNQECRWAYDHAQGFSKHKNYAEMLIKHYKAIWKRNIAVDIVRVEDDFSQYSLLAAPVLYMVPSGAFPRGGAPEQMRTKFDLSRKLETFVAAGGTLVATFHSGIVNENDLVYPGGYPGPLRKLLGVWVEEQDASPAGKTPNRLVLKEGVIEGHQHAYACDRYFDMLHAETAEVLATYAENWYAGRPCLTRNRFENGRAYYLGTDADDAFLADFYATLAAHHKIAPLADHTDGVEVLERVAAGRRLVFILNHAGACTTVALPCRGVDLLTRQPMTGEKLTVPPYGVFIIDAAPGA